MPARATSALTGNGDIERLTPREVEQETLRKQKSTPNHGDALDLVGWAPKVPPLAIRLARRLAASGIGKIGIGEKWHVRH